MALTLAVAVPLQAQAATNITVKNYTEMPFYDEAQLASIAKWTSESTVTTFGGTGRCTSIWGSAEGDAYDLTKAGNGILIQNVGTDLDGDSYDIKIVANSVYGVATAKGTVTLDVWNGSKTDKLTAGEEIFITMGAYSQGEAKLTFSYLKHGTSKAANVKATPYITDIDCWNYGKNYPKLMFNGNEGLSFEGMTGTVYSTLTSDMKVDESTGSVSYCGSKRNAYKSGDVDGTVTAFFNTSSFTVLFSGINCGLDMRFDRTFTNPGTPVKSAVITG